VIASNTQVLMKTRKCGNFILDFLGCFFFACKSLMPNEFVTPYRFWKISFNGLYCDIM